MPPDELVDLLERHGNNEFGVSGVGGEVVACGSFIGLFAVYAKSHSAPMPIETARCCALPPPSDEGSIGWRVYRRRRSCAPW